MTERMGKIKETIDAYYSVNTLYDSGYISEQEFTNIIRGVAFTAMGILCIEYNEYKDSEESNENKEE